MTEAIIVAVFSLAGNALGVIAGLRLMTYRIEQLERRVEKHNSVIERVFKLEQKVSDLEDRVK